MLDYCDEFIGSDEADELKEAFESLGNAESGQRFQGLGTVGRQKSQENWKVFFFFCGMWVSFFSFLKNNTSFAFFGIAFVFFLLLVLG